MSDRPNSAPTIRPLTFADIKASLADGIKDFAAHPLYGLFFASFYVGAGLLMAWVTYMTGHTFWLVLAVMGFPLVGAFAALGLYEVSRRRQKGEALVFRDILTLVMSQRKLQLPWLAVIIIVAFLFWFFLGHMIFALFLGLSPMTNVSSSLEVFLSSNGLMMLGFGSVVGAVFATIIFAISVLGMPMLLDRDIDFVTAMIRSVGAVKQSPAVYLMWGVFIGAVTLLALVPAFLGLFIVLPVLGHATWHLYRRVTAD